LATRMIGGIFTLRLGGSSEAVRILAVSSEIVSLPGYPIVVLAVGVMKVSLSLYLTITTITTNFLIIIFITISIIMVTMLTTVIIFKSLLLRFLLLLMNLLL
jgi:hypothetical protein